MQVAVVPVLLGGGERLVDGVAFPAAGWETAEVVPSASVTSVVLRRTGN